MRIIYSKDALEEALKIISKQFKYFKVLIISNTNNDKVFDGFISAVISSVKTYDILELPSGTIETTVVENLILNKLTEDVGLIINLSDFCAMQATTKLINKVKLMYVLNAPSLQVLNYYCDYLVADVNIIENCKLKNVANCYGELCSSCFYVLEQVFEKAVFQKQINGAVMLEIENFIKELSMLPSVVLKNKLGKHILFDMCLKLKTLVGDGLTESFVFKLSKQIESYSRYKNLWTGEAQMISSVLAFKSLSVLLQAKTLNQNIRFNYYSRLNFAKQSFSNLTLSKVYQSFVCDNNLSEHINNFLSIQKSFLYVFETYMETMAKLTKTFKKLYYDNGVSLNKYMSEQILIKAVNSVPETYNYCSYATFVRDVGLLNKIKV